MKSIAPVPSVRKAKKRKAMATLKPNQLVGIRILIMLVFITLTMITLEVNKLSKITVQISSAFSSENLTILTNNTVDNNNHSEVSNHDHIKIPNLSTTTRRRCNNGKISHNNNGLTAIVHIGPPKTGTTSIQSWTKVLLQQLTDDGYQLPWHLRLLKEEQMKTNTSYIIPNLKRATSVLRLHTPHNMVQIASCFMNTNRIPSRYCQPVIFDEIINISKNGKNLLLTAELFATFHKNEVKSLYQHLSKYYQNITIVMYYRRYSDWSVSQYYEWNKRKINTRESFLTHLSNDHTETWNLVKDNYMNSIITDINHCYYDNNITMKIYNFHNLTQYNNDLLLSFYCDAIPNAINTCNKLKELSIKLQQLEQQQQYDNNDTENDDNTEETEYLNKIQKLQNANQAIPFVYSDLVYAAYHKNLIPSINNINAKQQKGKVSKIIRMVNHYQENILNLTQYDFINESIICLNDNNIIMNRILNDTVTIEKIFFPNSFNSINIITNHNFHNTTTSDSPSESSNETYYNNIVNQVRKHFEQKKKALFCTVNASIVLQLDKRWQQFFQSIDIE